MDSSRSLRDTQKAITFYNVRGESNLYKGGKEDKTRLKKFMRVLSPKKNHEPESGSTIKSPVLKTYKHTSPNRPIRFDSLKLAIPKSTTSSEQSPQYHNFQSSRTPRILPEITSAGRHAQTSSNPIIDKSKLLEARRGTEVQTTSTLSRELTEESDRLHHFHTNSDQTDKLTSYYYSSSELKERTVTELKADSYRISEFALEYKDMTRDNNPAYDMAMPKDSARRKKLARTLYSTHDVSHLADVKQSAKPHRSMQRFLGDFKNENTLTDALNDIYVDNARSLTDRPAAIETLISMRENKASNNIAQSSSPRKLNFLGEGDDPFGSASVRSHKRREELRSTASPFIRKAYNRKYNSQDLTKLSSTTGFVSPGFGAKGLQKEQTLEDINARNVLLSSPSMSPPRDLIASLKKDIPNALGDAPSGRTEVILLQNWLANKINDLKKEKLEPKERLYKADQVYNITLNELIRQVCLECNERGELIKKVWKCYISLYDDILEDMQLHHSQNIKKQLEKHLTVQQGHKTQIDARDDEILKLNTHNIELQATIDNLKTSLSGANTEKVQLEDALLRTRNQFGHFKRRYDVTHREYEDIAYRYHKLKTQLHGEEDIFDPDEYIREKMKALSNIRSLVSVESDDQAGEQHYRQEANSREVVQTLDKANFGVFKGKKIELVDEATETDEILVSKVTTEEAEVQTELVTSDEKFDCIFVDNQTLEDLVKEQELKLEIQQDKVDIMEEDLQAEMYEHGIKSLIEAESEPKPEDNTRISSTESLESTESDESQSQDITSTYTESVNPSIHLDLDGTDRRGRRRSAVILESALALQHTPGSNLLNTSLNALGNECK